MKSVSLACEENETKKPTKPVCKNINVIVSKDTFILKNLKYIFLCRSVADISKIGTFRKLICRPIQGREGGNLSLSICFFPTNKAISAMSDRNSY